MRSSCFLVFAAAAVLHIGCALAGNDGRRPLHQAGGEDGGTSNGGTNREIRVLAHSPNLITAMALNDTHVYWADTTNFNFMQIMRVPREGGTPETLTPQLYYSSGIYELALDTTHVYWVAQAVFRVPLDGGTPEEIASTGGSTPQGIAVDATHAYWTGYNLGPDGHVKKVPLAGGEVVTIASDQACPLGPLVDATHMYWATSCEPGGEFYSGRIMKAPLAGGEPVILAERQPAPSKMTLDATHVYWVTAVPVEPEGESIRKVPITGGPVITLVSSEPADTVATDSRHVYWSTLLWTSVDTPAGAVRRIPVAGGAIEDLATGLPSPWLLALDDTTVYFALAVEDSTINAMPK